MVKYLFNKSVASTENDTIYGLISRVVYKKPLVHKDLEGCILCLYMFSSQ